MPRIPFPACLLAGLLLLVTGALPAMASIVITADTSNGTYVRFLPDDSTFSVLGGADQTAHIGNRIVSDTDRNQVVIYVFELPSRPNNNFVSDASLAFFLNQVNTPDQNVDLYGLRWSASNNILTTDYAAGPSLLQASILNTSMAPSTTIPRTTSAAGDASLALWVNSLYDNGADEGDFAFLQLKYAGPMPSGDTANYRIDTANNNDATRRPTLALDFALIPEPAAATLMLPGVLLLMRRNRSRG